jgi:GT2 family glycosyltransferase
MPSSPTIADRTWFGVARCDDGRVDIEGAIESWSGRHDNARLLLIDERGPIDWLLLEPNDVAEDEVLSHLAKAENDTERPLPLPLPLGDLTVAICTRDRPESLRACLARLRLATKGRYEILVIDNAPKSDGTRHVVEELAESGMRVRWVLETRPGLARARNRAITEASTAYVAFTDDDARPDGNWPEAIHRGFSAGERVAVVTGLVPPAQIETRSQALFEKKVKWSRNLTPETYSMTKRGTYDWPFPYSAGHFGTGANFAVDRSIIQELGGFDEALGAGTRTEGGEDMEIFVRVLRRGYELSYQPSAIVWHVHRADDEALRKVLFGYGKGLSATAVSEFADKGKLDMVRGSLNGARNLAKDRQGEIDYGMPWQHLLLELAGIAYGPIAYGLERWRGPRRT